MKSTIFVVFSLNSLIVVTSSELITYEKQVQSQNVSQRSERFFPFYSIVRFENSICIGTCKLTGACYTRKECKTYGGKPSGTCAKRLGVCCVVQKSCGGTSHVNNTYFQNPGFPSAYMGGSRCSLSITRCDSNICQLRLDFLSLDLAQPNATGECTTDSFTVTGGASRLMSPICGDLTGQHVYVDFDGEEPIQLSIKTSTANPKGRNWNIKATQIACDSAERAPSGCLMYYTEPSGTVKSFNFGESNSAGTRQIANTNYGICIAMAPNYCSIEWSTSTANSFSVSGDINTPMEVMGPDCTTDFIIIPNPIETPGYDRFCGTAFSTKTSSTKPFVLYTVTNGDETGSQGMPDDVGNQGFSLNYRQIGCSD